MSPEELTPAVHEGDVERCLRLIADASESERRACAKVASELRKQTWKQFIAPGRHWSDPDEQKARLAFKASCVAMAGTAILSELKKVPVASTWSMSSMYEIMAARRPDWLQEWVEWTLDQGLVPQMSTPNNWTVVRRLLKDGIISEPVSDGYISGMVASISFREPIKPRLLADPMLLDREVWRLFEVEGSRDTSLAGHDKYLSSWSDALLELSEEGRLDRQRLLTASLEALQRDFQPFHAGWYSRFHEALKPTTEERVARTDTYLALVASRVPPTVSFALKALDFLDKAGMVSPSTLLQALPAALSAREKSTALLALKLLGRVIARDTSLAHQTVHTVVEGLMHAAVEVQTKVLDILEKHDNPKDSSLQEALAARREDIAPSLRQRFEAIVGEQVRTAGESTTESDFDLDELIGRASKLDPRWLVLAGIPEAIEDCRTGKLTARGLPLDPMTVPRLNSSELIEPITDLDTLIDTFLAVIENGGPADDIERVLDGVSRLCGERPPDFDRRTSALKKRAETLYNNQQAVGRAGFITLSLCGLALAWTLGLPLDPTNNDISLTGFFHQRIIEIAYRASRRDPGQLLSAPTHRGGWLDPRVAVARFVSSAQNSLRPHIDSRPFLARLLKPKLEAAFESDSSRFDMIQAFLRLAPDGREAALAMASSVEGEVGDALRYVLGGPVQKVGSDEALWIAAARARNPMADDMHVEQRFPERGPGAGCAANLAIEWRGGSHQVTLRCDPSFPNDPRLDEPTVLHYAWRTYFFMYEFYAGLMVNYLSSTWPIGREAWLAFGASAIGSNIDWWEARWGDSVFLHLIAEPDTGLCGHGIDLLVLGLATKEAGQHGVATDVLIAAISDGRVTWNELGSSMAKIINVEHITPARWAKTLADASRVSPLHLITIRNALESVLAIHPTKKPGAMVSLLSLILELCIESQMPVTNSDALSYLRSIGGSGKAAGLAKSLIAQRVSCDEMSKRAAYLALSNRIDRAERWMASD